MNEFNAYVLCKKCKCCGHSDNDDDEDPLTFLDVKTDLCEFCFICVEDKK